MRTLHILFGSLGAAWERDQRDTLFLILAVFFTLIPHAQHLPGWITAITLALLGYRVWLTVHGRPLPPRWLLLPLALALALLLLMHFRTLLGRDAGVALLVISMALKLLEMHAKRDVFVVLYLGFFLILTNFLYSQSIPTALMMLVALLAILLAQMNLHFGNIEPTFRKKVNMAGLLLIQALPLMLALFVLFPRISGPLWGLPKDAHTGKTGLAETMAPGSVSGLALSGELAFRVEFDSNPPANAQLYWRGPVLDGFDGKTWYPLPARSIKDTNNYIAPRRGVPLHYTVTLEAHNKPWIFALEVPLAIPALEQYSVQLTSKMQLLSDRLVNERVRYRASSQPAFALVDEAHHLWQATILPEGYNPSTLAFAAELRQQEQDPVKLLQRVRQFFIRQPFAYSLNPPPLGRHTVDDFLFNTRSGFCEHYASSFVVLMRALEIPARVVTGYQGGEMNPVDGYMSIRQSDAHAWAEVWLPEQGWVRVDPTAWVAPNRIERGIAPSLPDNSPLPIMIRVDSDWLRNLRFNWEAINNTWNQWVLTFNSERQRDLLQRLGWSTPDWRSLILLLLVIAVITLTFIATILWLRHVRIDPLTRLYSRYCTLIAARGVEREVHEGALAFAKRALQQLEREQKQDRTGNKNSRRRDEPKIVRLIKHGALLYTDLRYQQLGKADYQHKFKLLKACVDALSRS